MPDPRKPDDLRLAADFPAATREQWLRLVDKVLAGAPFDKKLVARTYDGIAVQPLYTREDWNSGGDPSGLPGSAPFTRGADLLGTSQGGWDVRQSHGHPDPATANAQILADLEGGATSIVLRVDAEGLNGVAVRSLADLECALDGVMLDIAPVVLDPLSAPPLYAGLFAAFLQKRGVKDFAGNLGIDPLGNLAARGRLGADIDTALARVADVAVFTAGNFPGARAVNVNSVIFHSAGAADAQELACALGAGVEYLRVLTAAGLDIDAACKQMTFTIAVDADFVMSIAKVRAFRKLWALVAEACGAKLHTAPVTAASAPRMMTRRDPYVNMLRTTVACFAGGVAGADAVTALPFDAALGDPGELGRRVARNTQLVLLEEANLARVIDPAGGSWMFEKLTDDISAVAWTFFQEIEKHGGMAKALTSGFIAREIAKVRAERAKNIARRKDAITGVSEFPDIHEAPLETRKAAPKPATDPPVTVPPLPKGGDGTFTTAVIKAALTGAGIAALSSAGKSSTPVTLLAPLPTARAADAFESLRDVADAFTETYGRRPRIFLANIGNLADFTARAAFAKNFFEAGGLEAVAGAGGTEITGIIGNYKTSGASFAVLCSSDAVYAERAEEVVKALKDSGAALVYLAGRGGNLEVPLRSAGVDEFIFTGCDAKAILEAAYAKLKAYG